MNPDINSAIEILVEKLREQREMISTAISALEALIYSDQTPPKEKLAELAPRPPKVIGPKTKRRFLSEQEKKIISITMHDTDKPVLTARLLAEQHGCKPGTITASWRDWHYRLVIEAEKQYDT
jgi:hypothetical protein